MDRILVIDDSAVQAEFLRSILKDDYDVSIRNTAKEGLEAAKEGGYSLILLDVIMPDMDGFTVLQELKGTELTKHVPIILLTSLAEEQYEERGLLLGAVDYVAKPFSPVIIKARVNTHINLYHYQAEFKQQALVDDLTGVANRRCYEGASIAKWREAVRFGLPFSVCMFDIDKFKLYNDTFGHPAGDKVISAVAKTAGAYFQRSTDLFARYGGEEFVAVFVGNDGRSAFEFLKTIRQAVEDLHIPHNSPVCEWVTISVGGVSLVPKSGDDYGTFLKLADTMLYDAKRLGRNRVVWSNGGKEQWMEK
ncbi:MAG: diguanylate cyclase [Oscillospiraceae bacterium]|jgi:diguanylate cyclase (GGDEF)-like protein|nr:diguanylate cyclase [Oscillospiraceae bacterium]